MSESVIEDFKIITINICECDETLISMARLNFKIGQQFKISGVRHSG
jgi:hypothetical protein